MRGTYHILISIVALSFRYTSGAPSSDDVFLPLPPKPGATFLLEEPDAPECGTVDILSSRYNALRDPSKRWTNFYVNNDPNSDKKEKDAVNEAMFKLMQHLPCVKFGIFKENANPSGDYVQITREAKGCSSDVGRRGGKQLMNLKKGGCFGVGTVMHEMLHALGLHHEQCRPDRDDFVDIHLENIEPGKEHNFEKLSWDEWDTHGAPYEYQSIMHYGGTSFSKNKQPTITAKNGQTVGSQGELKEGDIKKLKAMYNC